MGCLRAARLFFKYQKYTDNDHCDKRISLQVLLSSAEVTALGVFAFQVAALVPPTSTELAVRAKTSMYVGRSGAG